MKKEEAVQENTSVAEIVKSEVDANNINSCTSEEKRLYKKLCGSIDKALVGIDKEFLKIAGAIWEINHKALFRAGMYKNITEFVADKYGMKKSAAYAYIKIVDRFFKIDEENGHPVEILDKWKDYSVSKLTAILMAPDEILDDFTPEMTVREIRDYVNRAEELVILKEETKGIEGGQMELPMNPPEEPEEKDSYEDLDVAPEENFYRVSSFTKLDELEKLKDVLSQTINDFKADKRFEGKKFHYELSLCWE